MRRAIRRFALPICLFGWDLATTHAADADAMLPTSAKVENFALPSAPHVLTAENVPGGSVAASTHEAAEAWVAVRGSLGLDVHGDYQLAMREAIEDRRMLFLYFDDSAHERLACEFGAVLADFEIQEKLARYVVAQLPREATIVVDGEPVVLLEHSSLAEMQGRGGVAIIDLAHPSADYYGHVVSAFPFSDRTCSRQALSQILDLPPGSITQRTMIYAVRMHPERPASTRGQFSDMLAAEARRHSIRQASILLQGHHDWEIRFHRISAKLPGGAAAREIVAESWPNENLVEACIDCVDSWRQSPGHWQAVKSNHALFAYDIHRGRNGIWYATGIFGGDGSP